MHVRVHAVWFYLHETLEKTQLITVNLTPQVLAIGPSHNMAATTSSRPAEESSLQAAQSLT